MERLTRRDCLRYLAGTAAALSFDVRQGRASAAEPAEGSPLCTGTYGMPGMPLEDALRAIAKIGFDGAEITVATGADGEPAKMPADRRANIRTLLADLNLQLPALMEHLYPTEDNAEHQQALERLRRVMQLSHDLNAQRPPLIQTVLGGGTWEAQKEMFRDRLADWVRLADEHQVTIAIKPHRGGALSQPSEAVWLMEQLSQPQRLCMVYDYSHYAFRGLPVEASVRQAAPYTGYVALKDAVEQESKVVFQLPGESGTFDYVELLRLLYNAGYRGAYCCEVSSQVSKQPGYDPLAAAATCYKHMSAAFEKAGVRRA